MHVSVFGTNMAPLRVGRDNEGLPAVCLQGGKGKLANIWDVVDAQPLETTIGGHCSHRQICYLVAAPDGQALHCPTDCQVMWSLSMRSANSSVVLSNNGTTSAVAPPHAHAVLRSVLWANQMFPYWVYSLARIAGLYVLICCTRLLHATS